MTEIWGISKRDCMYCHYEQVTKTKSDEEPCKTCFTEDTIDNRFPKFKEINKTEEVKNGDETS